jgi:hypothetical protein
MDGERFDSLARVVASHRSRRGLLRGLAGTVGLLVLGRRAPRVAAQTGYLGPGEACYDDSQCGNTKYSPMFCADNGFDYDGALNCCAYEGGYCYGDGGCCGSASCITGSCVSPTSNASAGDPCQTTDECFASGLVCDYVGQTDDFRCCTYEGGGCGWDGGCCGSLTCIAGVCGDPGASAGYPGAIDSGLNQTGYGFPPGQACIADSQCDNSYPELGITYCADTGVVYGAYGGTQHCCRYEGGSCGGPLSDDNSLCCGNLLCLGGRCGWG